MADKLIYIPNDDTQNYPFCRLKLVIETFDHLIKIQCSPQSCKGKEEENVIIKLWRLVW